MSIRRPVRHAVACQVAEGQLAPSNENIQLSSKAKPCVTDAEKLSLPRRDFIKSVALLGGGALASFSVGGVNKAVAAVLATQQGSGPTTLLNLPLLAGLYATVGDSANLTRKVVPLNGTQGTTPDYLASNTPVFANSAYGEPLGVLTEHDGNDAAQNLPVDSGIISAPQDPSRPVWIRRNIAKLAPNSGIASDGSNRLWLLSEGGARGVHDISQQIGDLASNSLYTINAVVRSDNLKFAALQFKSTAGNYCVARFNLSTGKVHGKYKAVDCGVTPKANGLFHIWASFNTETGGSPPIVYLQFLYDDGVTTRFAGRGRTLYVSECWMSQGSGATDYQSSVVSKAISSNGEYLVQDAVSTNSSRNIKPNNCSGIISFQYRNGISAYTCLWSTGIDENNYCSLGIEESDLVFKKVHSGVVTRCAHAINWAGGVRYHVGWRSSDASGMELILNGQQFAVNRSTGARLDMDIGGRIFIGSDGDRIYSSCPVSDFRIFDES